MRGFVERLGQEDSRRAANYLAMSDPQEIVEIFASNLRRERERQGLSKRALGRATGSYTTEITRLENADRDPRITTVSRLAHALGVSPADLLKGAR